jgi:hypothetical protein
VGSSSKQDPQWDPDGLEVTDQRIARKPKDGNRNSGGQAGGAQQPVRACEGGMLEQCPAGDGAGAP